MEAETDFLNRVAEAAMLAGMLILENGGETYRAEETAYYVCRTGGMENPEIIALPTGIFLSGSHGQKSNQNGLMRVKNFSVNLDKLERTNAHCRAYARGEIELEELYRRLCELRQTTREIPLVLRVLISGLTTAAFALMMDGGIHDVWISLVCGMMLSLCTQPFSKSTFSGVWVSFVGGMVISLVAVVLTYLIGCGTTDIIIVSATMPLLPGVAALNAVRDAMQGDLVSGNARLLRAMMIAISIAAGVGLTLSCYLSLGGVL